MTFSSKPLFLALTLAMGATFSQAAATPSTVQAGQRLAPSGRLDFADVARVHRQAVLAGELDAVYARLDAAAGAQRSRALLTKAAMKWQDGDLDAAMSAVNGALDLGEDLDAVLLKARLLDIQGQAGAASVWYGKAREATGDPAEKASIDVRLAVIGVTGRRPDALGAYARGKAPEMAARAAAALALLGDPKGAIGLYPVQGVQTGSYVQDIRLANWAIAAEDFSGAAKWAWDAFAAAKDSGDQRYALALLAEAFRSSGDLAAAVRFLAAKPPSIEADQARLDMLLELGRYDDAVALVARSGAPQMRQRLLGVLKVAGRETEVEAEYRRLIAQNPGEGRWYQDLATLYLGRGQRAQAVAVYVQLFDANRGRVEILTEAARRMIAMGLSQEALARLGDAATDPALAVPVKQFLAETALDQGRDAEAQALLGELERLRPTDLALLIDLADDYERLGRKDRALQILAQLEAQGRTLDYDQQAHIADLAFDLGRYDEALSRWRRLWDQTQLPARKAYLQGQIIKTAKRLNRLEPIASQLDQRIADGSAGPGDLKLLVEIRIVQEDGRRAEAALQAYAASRQFGEVEKLEQLSVVQARLRQYAALNQSLRRLVELDPKNADGYLRRLVVNTLRYPVDGETEADRTRAVDGLLARMRASAGLTQAESAQFAAVTYAASNQTDKALEQYRQVVALAPDDIDSLLQMTQLLSRQGKSHQAVALLQYKAETTVDPAALNATIGGLMDVLAADPGSPGVQAPPPDLVQASLAWAKRAMLERIVRDGDDVRLDSLLADIAQDRGEYDLQLRALEASLPVAGDQRAAVLRQLISLTSGSAGAEGGLAIGDMRRKAIFGRRLIALKREYPPEVYGDMARTLLLQGDLPGAERAFDLIDDVGGLVNTDAMKGEAYARSSHLDLALTRYKLALLQDQDNLGLIVNAAILMEQAGESEAASDLYWRGLMLLLQGQPVSVATTGETSGVDVAQYSPTLMEGVLLTWPKEPAQQAARLAQWRETFAGVSVLAKPDTSLADQARLDLALKINRRIAESLGDASLAALEAPFAARFAADGTYQSDLNVYRGVSGLGEAIATNSGSDWPMQGLQAQADAADNFDLNLALAFRAPDLRQIDRLVTTAITAEARWRASAAELGSAGPQPAMLLSLLLRAAAVAEPAIIRQHVLAPLEASTVHDAVLFDVLRISPSAYQTLERAAGTPLLPDATLIRLMVEHGNDPLPVAGAARGARGGPDPLSLMISRFQTPQLIDFYEALVARAERTGELSGLQDTLCAHLLARPLDAKAQERLLPILNRDLALERQNQPHSAAFAAPRLLAFETPPENRRLLLSAARAVAQRYPDGRRLPDVLDAWFAGDRTLAFRALTDLYADTSAVAQSGDYASGLIATYFQVERRAEIDAFMAADRLDPQAIDRFYRRFVLSDQTPAGGPSLRLAAFQKLTALAPDNVVYLTGLLYIHAQKQDWRALVTTARPYLDRHRDHQEAATVAGLAYRLVGEESQALAVARAASVDLDDADWIKQMVNRAQVPRGGIFEPDFRQLFGIVWSAYQDAQPDAVVVRTLNARQASEAAAVSEVGGATTMDRLAEHPDAARGLLRGLWRKFSPRGREDGDLSERTALIEALSGGDDGDGAAQRLRLLTSRPDLTQEIESYLAAMEPQARQRQAGLYALVARGEATQGLAQVRLTQLLSRLTAGTITDHELALLGALGELQGLKMDAAQRGALAQRLTRAPILSANQRLAFATLLANGGDTAAAQGLMQAAVMQTLYPAANDFTTAGAKPITAQDVTDALAAWSDAAAVARVHAALQTLLANDPAMQRSRRPFEPLPPLSLAKR